MEIDYEVVTMPHKKHIALVAHDSRKSDIIDWAIANKETLAKHFLCGTGTTATLIADALNLPIHAYNSGPLGGDQQIGSRIAEGGIDMVIFFWDPLSSQPHDPDIKALLRIAALYNIPVATNQITAEFIFSSGLMDIEYERKVINYGKRLKQRVETMKSE